MSTKFMLPILSLAFILPGIALAQPIDALYISNNSNTSIAFLGDKNQCIGQTDPRSITAINKDDFNRLCAGTHCSVYIYSNYSCAGFSEYSFDFNAAYGVGAFHAQYPHALRAEGYQNNVFVVSKE